MRSRGWLAVVAVAAAAFAQPDAPDSPMERYPARFVDVLRTRPYLGLFPYGKDQDRYLAVLLTEAQRDTTDRAVADYEQRMQEWKQKQADFRERIHRAELDGNPVPPAKRSEEERNLNSNVPRPPFKFGAQWHRGAVHRIVAVGDDYLAVQRGEAEVFYPVSVIARIERPAEQDAAKEDGQ